LGPGIDIIKRFSSSFSDVLDENKLERLSPANLFNLVYYLKGKPRAYPTGEYSCFTRVGSMPYHKILNSVKKIYTLAYFGSKSLAEIKVLSNLL